MAQSTRDFLTSGPIAGDPGDITTGLAYHVVHRQITKAINDAAEKEDANSKKVIDELKALRSHFKEEAERYSTKKISQLPPDIANEFLEVNRLIKNITGQVPGTGPSSGGSVHQHPRYHHDSHRHGGGVVNALSSGPIGAGVLAASQAVLPGSAVIVKAIQENSHVIMETFRTLGHVSKFLIGVYDLTKTTFSAVHNFLNPNHPHSIVHAIAKLFGGGKGGGGILSRIGDFLMGSGATYVLKRMLPLILAGFRVMSGIGLAFIVSHFIEKGAAWLRDKLGYTPIDKWKKVLEFDIFGEDLFSLKLDPKIWGWLFPSLLDKEKGNTGGTTRGFLNPPGAAVPGGPLQQSSLDLGLGRGIESLKVGYDVGFNTGIASDEDTILQLLSRQTELLAKILRAILTGGGYGGGPGFIRAYQGGGVIPPGQLGIVNEDGGETVTSQGQTRSLGGPAVVKAGDSPVTVNPAVSSAVPLPSARPKTGSAGRPGGVFVPRYEGDPTSDPLLGRTFQPGTPTIFYTGPQGQKSVTYTDPATGQSYTDRTPPIGPPASHAASETPGIAFGYRGFPRQGRETLGGYYLVTPKSGENAGESFVLQHTDTGPDRGAPFEKLDYNAPAAAMVFGSLKESALQGGTYLRYIGRDLPEGVTPGKQPSETISEKFTLSKEHIAFIQQQQASRIANAGGQATTQASQATQATQASQPQPAVTGAAAQQNVPRTQHPVPGGAAQQQADMRIRDHPTTGDQRRHIDSFRSTERQQRQQQQRRRPAPERPSTQQRRTQKSTGTTFSSAGFITTGGGFA